MRMGGKRNEKAGVSQLSWDCFLGWWAYQEAEMKADSHAEYSSACILFHLFARQLTQIHSSLLLISRTCCAVLCQYLGVNQCHKGFLNLQRRRCLLYLPKVKRLFSSFFCWWCVLKLSLEKQCTNQVMLISVREKIKVSSNTHRDLWPPPNVEINLF